MKWPLTSTPASGSDVGLLHLVQVLNCCDRDWAVPCVSWNELVEGMRGGLEFIEYLWVGDCDPVEKLGELFVGVSRRVQVEFKRHEFGLDKLKVGVGHSPEIVQLVEVERVFIVVALINGV